MGKRISETEKALFLQLAQQRLSLRDIEKITGRNRGTVKNTLLSAGIIPYWEVGKSNKPRKKKAQNIHLQNPFEPCSSKIIPLFDGFTSVKTGAHYYVTQGIAKRFFVAANSATYYGMISDKGYKTREEAREALAYLKNLIEQEGGTCIDDIQN